MHVFMDPKGTAIVLMGRLGTAAVLAKYSYYVMFTYHKDHIPLFEKFDLSRIVLSKIHISKEFEKAATWR